MRSSFGDRPSTQIDARNLVAGLGELNTSALSDVTPAHLLRDQAGSTSEVKDPWLVREGSASEMPHEASDKVGHARRVQLEQRLQPIRLSEASSHAERARVPPEPLLIIDHRVVDSCSEVALLDLAQAIGQRTRPQSRP